MTNIDQLMKALKEANLPILLVVMYLLTDNKKWIEPPFLPERTRALQHNEGGGFSPEMQAYIRSEACQILKFYMRRQSNDGLTICSPEPEEIIRLLSISLGEDIPLEYAEPFAQEGGFVARPGLAWDKETAWGDTTPPQAVEDFRVAIIGGGPAGIAAAIGLERLGIPYVLFERNEDFGGVWLVNDYPGAGVDTNAFIYSYSFAPRHAWSRYYPERDEILEYFQSTAEWGNIRKNTYFRHEVISTTWSEEESTWTVLVRDSAGQEFRIESNTVISCVGILTEPTVPEIEGLEKFSQPIFHASAWDESVEVREKTVAVIGAGATSVQVVPAISKETKQTNVFQRSPQWVAPNPNYHTELSKNQQFLMENLPFYEAFYRLRQTWQAQDKLLPSLRKDPNWPKDRGTVNATNQKHRDFFARYIKEQLRDRPELLESLTPDYPPYGKRMLMDNHWFKTLQSANVDLITSRISHFTEKSIVTDDGSEYPADVVVLATGFRSSHMLNSIDVTGKAGQNLRQVWNDDDPFAYLGITVPGFPNFFIIGGPNTALGHGGSMIYSLECSLSYSLQLIVKMIKSGYTSVDVREELARSYAEAVDKEHESLVWTHPGMDVWYRNKRGRVVAAMPWRGVDYWKLTSSPQISDYEVS